jgi:peptide deformylase
MQYKNNPCHGKKYRFNSVALNYDKKTSIARCVIHGMDHVNVSAFPKTIDLRLNTCRPFIEKLEVSLFILNCRCAVFFCILR